MAVHTFVIHLNEEEVQLPPDLTSTAFQERLRRFEMGEVVAGRQAESAFDI
jgi:hypothetical protein